jgi:hypothetical protein
MCPTNRYGPHLPSDKLIVEEVPDVLVPVLFTIALHRQDENISQHIILHNAQN